MLKRNQLLLLLIPIIISGFYSFTVKNEIYIPVSKIKPINTDKVGYDFLSKIQGQWKGINSVAGINYDWFVFDYRAIDKSHIHGIYEGGSMGNLFTSFFIANFKGQKTIMARNGGLLNGIYRTSYFVMDSIHQQDNNNYYRLVDAVGGKETMYMELRFKNDSLYWNSYTSGLGARSVPKRHMTYKGHLFNNNLAKKSAEKFDFPKDTVAYSFPTGFDNSYLYMKKSASFLAQGKANDVYKLAKESLDPITINDYGAIAELTVELKRNKKIKEKPLLLNISEEPLTNNDGVFIQSAKPYNSIVLFPYLNAGENEFTFTYMHPGKYYVTAIVDIDENYYISKGDVANSSKEIVILPNSKTVVKIDDITTKNKFDLGFERLSIKPLDKTTEDLSEEVIPVINRKVTYNSEVKHIVFNNCITCHSGISPSDNLDLSKSGALVQAVKDRGLIKRMNNKEYPMPPRGMLSLEERMIVFKWVKDGMPIN